MQTKFLYVVMIFGFFACRISRADGLDGFTLYIPKDTTIGDLPLKAETAILVDQATQAVDGSRARIKFRVLQNGVPGDPHMGWVDLSDPPFITASPPSAIDPKKSTTEPNPLPARVLAKALDALVGKHPCTSCSDSNELNTELVERLCAADDNLCKKAVPLIVAFHNSPECAKINVLPKASDPSRGDQILTAWQKFANADDQSRVPSEVLNRARDLDMIGRTADFESYAPTLSSASMQDCDMAYSVLSMINRATGPWCDVAKDHPENREPRFGCHFKGDFTGVDSLPNEYNIWLRPNTFRSRVAGCFLRTDAEAASWDSAFDKIDFFSSKEQYLRAITQAEQILHPPNGQGLAGLFTVQQTDKKLSIAEQNKILNSVDHYYNPGGMPKCGLEFNDTVYVNFGYATKPPAKGDSGGSQPRHLIMVNSRVFVVRDRSNKIPPGDVTVKSMYQSGGGLSQAARAAYFKNLSGAVIPKDFVDPVHETQCWPPAKKDGPCSSIKTTRIAPMWAFSELSKKLKFGCKGAPGSEIPFHQWDGICDQNMVVIANPDLGSDK